MLGPELDLVRLCRSGPTFNYCPIMLTGGMTIEKIPEAVQAGVVLIGSGFDLLLKDQDLRLCTQKNIIEILKQYREKMRKAIDTTYSELARLRNANNKDWLAALPHQHPFGDDSF
jgi:hypothetical protein